MIMGKDPRMKRQNVRAEIETQILSKINGVYFEVEMEDVHLVHVLKPFTDLTYKQHRVQLCQVVVLVNDAVKQLSSLHAANKRGMYFCCTDR